MKKYFVLATVLGALALPVTVSSAMAEETKMEKAEEAKPSFFERQKERFQKWREESAKEQEAAKEQHKDEMKKNAEKKSEKRQERVAKAESKKAPSRASKRDYVEARREKAQEKRATLNKDEPTKVTNIKARGAENTKTYRRVENINE